MKPRYFANSPITPEHQLYQAQAGLFIHALIFLYGRDGSSNSWTIRPASACWRSACGTERLSMRSSKDCGVLVNLSAWIAQSPMLPDGRGARSAKKLEECSLARTWIMQGTITRGKANVDRLFVLAVHDPEWELALASPIRSCGGGRIGVVDSTSRRTVPGCCRMACGQHVQSWIGRRGKDCASPPEMYVYPV